MHRCVTKFMLDTCLFSTNEHTEEIPFLRFLARAYLGNTAELFMAGSSAEIRIKPMLSCIGDIDMMLALGEHLAIPQGCTPPTKLPSYFQKTVGVHEIIDSHQPGFVYLRSSCTLTKSDTGHYTIKENKNEKSCYTIVHGSYKIDTRKVAHNLPRYVNQQISWAENSVVLSVVCPTSEWHGRL